MNTDKEDAELWRYWAHRVLQVPAHNFAPQTTYWDLRHAAVEWKDAQIEKPKKICPNVVNGACQLHNLHCGFPKCVEGE